MTVRRLLLVLALFSAAMAATQASATSESSASVRGERVLFPANCRKPVYKPARIIVTCADANFVIERIAWSSWTTARARGGGTASVNSCTPDCASGTFESYPVRVALYTAKTCRSARPRQFVRIAVTFTGPRPTGFPKTERFLYGCGFGT